LGEIANYLLPQELDSEAYHSVAEELEKSAKSSSESADEGEDKHQKKSRKSTAEDEEPDLVDEAEDESEKVPSKSAKARVSANGTTKKGSDKGKKSLPAKKKRKATEDSNPGPKKVSEQNT
jgi:hypothetical protein